MGGTRTACRVGGFAVLLLIFSLAIVGVGTASAAPPCQGDQIHNVTESDDQAICIWERAGLPFRADDDDAATSVRNLDLRFETETEEISANRPRLSVYQRNAAFDIVFDDASGANTDQFQGNDVQLLVARPSGNISNLTFNVSNTTGTTTVSSNATTFQVLDDGQGVTALDGTGGINITYTATESNGYLFVLTQVDDGPGLSTNTDGDLVIDGNVTFLGVESVPVQQAPSAVSPTQPEFEPGDNVSFTVDTTNLDTDTANHTIVLYDEATFTQQELVIFTNASLDAYVSGDANESNVTLKSSIAEVNGIARLDGGNVVDDERFAGTHSVTDLVTFLVDSLNGSGPAVETTNTVTLNASATAILNGSDSQTIEVETFDNFSEGTYRWVHVAEGSNFSTTTGTVQLQTTADGPPPSPPPEEPPPAQPPPGGGGLPPPAPPIDTGVPDISIVSADLNTTQITAGGAVTVTATVENTGNASGTIDLTLVVDEAATDRTRTVRVAADETRTVSFIHGFDEPGTYVIDVNEVRAGTLTVEPGPTETVTETVTETPSPLPPTVTEGDGGFPWGILVMILVVLLLLLVAGAVVFLLVESARGI